MTQSRGHRGVTLIELMIAITIMTILGAAIMSVMLGYNRFEERTESQRTARLVARSGVNVLVSGLRMLDPTWSVEAATATSLTVKAPYAMGVVCASTTGSITAAILPVDSLVFATPGYSGFAWRGKYGDYTVMPGGSVSELSGFPAACSMLGVVPITAPAGAPNQRTHAVTLTIGVGGSGTPIPAGTPIMLYRRARFYFAASNQASLAGRTALWRDYLDDNSSAVEQAAPFDATAAFRFFVSGSATPQVSPPGTLSTLRGVQLYLPGESGGTPRQRTSPEQSDLTTAVFFVNTMAP